MEKKEKELHKDAVHSLSLEVLKLRWYFFRKMNIYLVFLLWL